MSASPGSGERTDRLVKPKMGYRMSLKPVVAGVILALVILVPTYIYPEAGVTIVRTVYLSVPWLPSLLFLVDQSVLVAAVPSGGPAGGPAPGAPESTGAAPARGPAPDRAPAAAAPARPEPVSKDPLANKRLQDERDRRGDPPDFGRSDAATELTEVTGINTMETRDGTFVLALVGDPRVGLGTAMSSIAHHCKGGNLIYYDRDGLLPDGPRGPLITKVWCTGQSDNMPQFTINEMLLDDGLAELHAPHCSGTKYGGQEWARDAGC